MHLPAVLFVDDDANLLASIRRGLHSHGCGWESHFANSSQEAQTLFNLRRIDVVVSDLMMPLMSGIELISLLRTKSTRHMDAIILTGEGSFDTALEAINSVGVAKYLTKPCSISRLVEEVHSVLARHAPKTVPRSLTALSMLSTAVILTRADGYIVDANESGQKLVAADNTLGADLNHRLISDRPDTTRRLQEAIYQAGVNESHQISHVPLWSEIKGKLNLSITRMACAEGDAAVMIVVTDPDRPIASTPQSLALFLGLTPSESRLVHALALYGYMERAAQECGLTVESARTYLKRVYSKTGLHGQSELMRTIFSLPDELLSI